LVFGFWFVFVFGFGFSFGFGSYYDEAHFLEFSWTW
jgi:hypothetical protein